MDARTSYSRPRYLPTVRAFAGDSTITSLGPRSAPPYGRRPPPLAPWRVAPASAGLSFLVALVREDLPPSPGEEVSGDLDAGFAATFGLAVDFRTTFGWAAGSGLGRPA